MEKKNLFLYANLGQAYLSHLLPLTQSKRLKIYLGIGRFFLINSWHTGWPSACFLASCFQHCVPFSIGRSICQINNHQSLQRYNIASRFLVFLIKIINIRNIKIKTIRFESYHELSTRDWNIFGFGSGSGSKKSYFPVLFCFRYLKKQIRFQEIKVSVWLKMLNICILYPNYKLVTSKYR